MEAMSMGLPVIATNWGGNTAFMNNHNSFLFSCIDLVEIKEGPWKGHKWCEPNYDSLSTSMRYLYENPKQGKKIGKKARNDIINHYSLPVIGELLDIEFNRIYNKIYNYYQYDI